MFRILSELIFDKKTNWIVTFNRPNTSADYLELISLAFDALYEKKKIDSPNIKCQCLDDFRLIFSVPGQSVRYIQNYPEKGKEASIL